MASQTQQLAEGVVNSSRMESRLNLQALVAVGVSHAGPGVRTRDPRLDVEYLLAEGRIVAMLEAGWVPRTMGEREKQAAEFSAWLAALPAARQKGWHDVTPEDVLVFLEHSWLPTHGTFALGHRGGRGVAPGYLETSLSHLSTSFKLLGRSAQWDGPGAVPEHSNPVLSYAVRRYMGGFRREVAKVGYVAGSAPAWDDHELGMLVRHLDIKMEVYAAAPLRGSSLAIMRDQAMVLFAWESGKRASDCAHLQRGNLTREGGGQLVLEEMESWPDGMRVVCKMFSKTRKEAPGPAVVFTYCNSAVERDESWLWRLGAYALARAETGCPLGEYLFTPLRRGSIGRFEERPLTTTAANNRLAEHFKSARMDAKGKSYHGLRRGRTQKLAATVGEAAAKVHLDMRSQKTFAVYNDPHRSRRFHASQLEA